MRVMLAGEGPTEIGGWAEHPWYRDDPPETGVIGALLRRVRAEGWTVHDAVLWKRIRKFRSGEHRSAEERNVLGLADIARHSGCAAVCFARDRDRDSDRERAIEDALQDAAALFPELRIAGGVATETIEAWILALQGKRGSEALFDPKSTLASEGVHSTRNKVAVVEAANLDAVPEDAGSLRRWLGRARVALGATAP